MPTLGDTLTFAVLVLEVVALGYADRRIYGRWVTPFNLLAWPYLAVVALVLAFAGVAEYFPLKSGSVWLWIGGLAVFWACGSAPAHVLFGRRLHQDFKNLNGEGQGTGRLVVVALLCMAASAYGVVRAGGLSGASLSSDEFRNAYRTGWPAHVRVLSYSLIMYFVGIKVYVRKRMALLVLGLLVFVAVGTGKSWMIIPIFTGLVYQVVTQRLRLSVKAGVKAFAFFFAIFCAAYLIRFSSDNAGAAADPKVYLFLVKHFFGYLSSGVLALSARWHDGVTIPSADWRVVFSPILNMASAVTGGALVSGVTEYWVKIAPDFESNVHTLFGTLYIHLGLLGMLIYVAVLAFLVNVLYATAIVKRSCWLLVAALFEMSLLAFGWFDNYSGNLAMFEVPIWTLVLMVVAQGRVNPGPVTASTPHAP